MGDIKRIRVGDPIAADLFNEIADRLKPLANLSVAQCSGLLLSSGPRGHSLALALPHEIWVQLSGSTSPYDWVEVAPVVGGTWAPFGFRGASENAYEFNGLGGLGGKVVRVWWTAGGDMRFEYPRKGSSNHCKGHGNKITFNLVGCNGTPVAGATVDFILGGITVLSTTTDTSGNAVYFEPPPGTYTINWSFGALSGTKTATITSSCFDSAPSDTLLHVAPSGYTVCCPSCIWPLPSTIHLTDSNTTVSLVWNNSLSQPGWEQIYIVRVGVDGQSTYKIHYLLQCDGTFIQVFDGEFPGRDSPKCTGTGGSGTIPIGASDFVSVNVGSFCNYPFAPFSGTWPATGPCGYDTLASGPFSGTS